MSINAIPGLSSDPIGLQAAYEPVVGEPTVLSSPSKTEVAAAPASDASTEASVLSPEEEEAVDAAITQMVSTYLMHSFSMMNQETQKIRQEAERMLKETLEE